MQYICVFIYMTHTETLIKYDLILFIIYFVLPDQHLPQNCMYWSGTTIYYLLIKTS